MPTYFDMALRPSTESWRVLRRRRATQSIPAGGGVRAETFRSSLEQAEQQFAAAGVVGYDSRALNLFYGLSQAERAIAAAAPGGEWELSGHVIGAPDLAVSDLLALRLKSAQPGGAGNFVRVSTLLNSDVSTELSLGAVWPLLVDTVLHERADSPTPAPLFVSVHAETVANSGSSVTSASIPLKDVHQPPGGCWWEPGTISLEDFMARYPQLRGWERDLPSGAPLEWPRPPLDHLQLRWTSTELPGGPAELRARLTLHRGQRIAYPVVDGRTDVMHPLLAWHAILFGLSMLTRYSPARWTRMIDVDHSRRATLIEYVLDLALEAVPDLIDEAITTVTETPQPTRPDTSSPEVFGTLRLWLRRLEVRVSAPAHAGETSGPNSTPVRATTETALERDTAKRPASRKRKPAGHLVGSARVSTTE